MDTTNSNTTPSTPTPDLAIPPEARVFIEGILDDSKTLSLDGEMREEMIKEIYARLDSFLTSRIVESLPPEFMDEFLKLVEEKKSQVEIQKFIEEKIPNSPEVFAQAFSDFRDMYLYGNAVGRKIEGLKEDQDDSK